MMEKLTYAAMGFFTGSGATVLFYRVIGYDIVVRRRRQ